MTASDSTRSNQSNARKSTGPRTRAGKAMSSLNALNHGILSRNLLLPDEDPVEWAELLERLLVELCPVGSLEQILVERIAVAVWRQRRLVNVESARIQVAQRPDAMTRHRAAGLVGGGSPKLVKEIVAGIGEEERIRFLEDLLTARSAQVSDLDVLRVEYPSIWQRLLLHANTAGGVTQFLASQYQGKLDSYLAAMQVSQARILVAYEEARLDKAAAGLPAAPQLMSRYQSALDNDLYKAMRALREAQRFRRESLDVTAVAVLGDDAASTG